MSRSDQYVGMTKQANDFIDRLKSELNAICETCKVCDQAFNPDPIHGDKITIGDRTYKEELQMEPWSSGPMYFTHVAIYNNKTGKLIGYIGSWELGKPTPNNCEYADASTGKYFI